jgi:hypothetical protein
MTRAELLELVTALRDERGPTFDAAAYDVLCEVAWFLEREPATTVARDELRPRVTSLRDDRGRTHDPILWLVLTRVIAGMGGEDPPPTVPMGSRCEICGASASRCECRTLPAYVTCPSCGRRVRAGQPGCPGCGRGFHESTKPRPVSRPQPVAPQAAAAAGGCSFCGYDGSRCPVCQPD